MPKNNKATVVVVKPRANATRRNKKDKLSKVMSRMSIGRNLRVDRSSVSTAPVQRFVQPKTYFTTGKSKYGTDALLVRGRDFLGTYSATANAAVGTSFLNLDMNPLGVTFNGTRLQRQSSLYEKYLFTRLKFHLVTSSGTNGSGSYILAYDRDMADATPPPTVAGVKQYFAMANSDEQVFWKDTEIDCPLIDTQDFYYTNYTGRDGRLSSQGQVYAAIITPYANTTSYSLYVEYEVHFMVPGLEEIELPASFKTIPITPYLLPNNNALSYSNYISQDPDPTIATDAGSYWKSVQLQTPFGLTMAPNPTPKSMEISPGRYRVTLCGTQIGDATTSSGGTIQTLLSLVANLNAQTRNCAVNYVDTSTAIAKVDAYSTTPPQANFQQAINQLKDNQWMAQQQVSPAGNATPIVIHNVYDVVVPIGGAILNAFYNLAVGTNQRVRDLLMTIVPIKG